MTCGRFNASPKPPAGFRFQLEVEEGDRVLVLGYAQDRTAANEWLEVIRLRPSWEKAYVVELEQEGQGNV